MAGKANEMLYKAGFAKRENSLPPVEWRRRLGGCGKRVSPRVQATEIEVNYFPSTATHPPPPPTFPGCESVVVKMPRRRVPTRNGEIGILFHRRNSFLDRSSIIAIRSRRGLDTPSPLHFCASEPYHGHANSLFRKQ